MVTRPRNRADAAKTIIVRSVGELSHTCVEVDFPARLVVPDHLMARTVGQGGPDGVLLLTPTPVAIVRKLDLVRLQGGTEPLRLQNKAALPLSGQGFHPEALLRVHIFEPCLAWERAFLDWWFGPREWALRSHDWNAAVQAVQNDEYLRGIIRRHVLGDTEAPDRPLTAGEIKKVTASPLGPDYLKKLSKGASSKAKPKAGGCQAVNPAKSASAEPAPAAARPAAERPAPDARRPGDEGRGEASLQPHRKTPRRGAAAQSQAPMVSDLFDLAEKP